MTSLHRHNIHFDTHESIPAHWFDGQCQLTRFYDAMSIMFPEGERAFIETVQCFRQQVNDHPVLAHEATEFIAQEALHSREHARFNRWLIAQGLPLEKLEL